MAVGRNEHNRVHAYGFLHEVCSGSKGQKHIARSCVSLSVTMAVLASTLDWQQYRAQQHQLTN
eukprot:8366-Heterococcus_DN1.PRE.4